MPEFCEHVTKLIRYCRAHDLRVWSDTNYEGAVLVICNECGEEAEVILGDNEADNYDSCAADDERMDR